MKLIHEFTKQVRNPNFDLSYLKVMSLSNQRTLVRMVSGGSAG